MQHKKIIILICKVLCYYFKFKVTYCIKRDCPFFDNHVALFQQNANGTFFIPFLENSLILIPLFLYNIY
jgi:hypothetical protein